MSDFIIDFERNIILGKLKFAFNNKVNDGMCWEVINHTLKLHVFNIVNQQSYFIDISKQQAKEVVKDYEFYCKGKQ